MNGSQIFPSKQRTPIWLALCASLLLHGAAVALAQIHRDPMVAAPEISDPGVILELDTSPAPPEQIPPPDPPNATPPVADPQPSDFREDPPTPLPRTVRTKVAPLVRPSSRQSGLTSSSARALALSAPRPEYPYEARRGRITGEGVAVLSIDPASGRVLEVTMSSSTGSVVLDQASIAGFRQWRFKAGGASTVRCPITYTLTGAHF